MRRAVGSGEGVILAVHPTGDLHWYCYYGNGESDESGRHGWHPNSGNVIGIGWADFQHIFALPTPGTPQSAFNSSP